MAGHGFAQIGDAAGLFGLLANLGRIMRGDEDDRNRAARLSKLSLQIEARHATKLNVEHQAIRLRQRCRCDEGLGGGKIKDFKSRCAEQTPERAGKTLIVIHDRDIDFASNHPDRIHPGDSAATVARRGGS